MVPTLFLAFRMLPLFRVLKLLLNIPK